MHPSLLEIKYFNYHLPETAIAQYPLQERDASKLLVVSNSDKKVITQYKNITAHLPEHTLLVMNQTKVVHARLKFKKETGGLVEVFCLEPDIQYADVQTAMMSTRKVLWKCLVGGAAKWKDGQVLHLTQPGLHLEVTAQVQQRNKDYFLLELAWNEAISFAEVLQIMGAVPLPPYLNREVEQQDADRYQTIFAKESGSVAAPTAALHFTPALLQHLLQAGINTAMLTLHVGAGTFKPVKSTHMQDHDMHAEWLSVEVSCIRQLIDQLQQQQPIVAVGTTSARTLESLYWIGVRLSRKESWSTQDIAVPQWYPYDEPNTIQAVAALKLILEHLQQQQITTLVARTQIIIAPGYTFRIINGLVTNFHQPQSTLLLLVAAIVGDTWSKIYEYALQNEFRFLSYGDGCLLWVDPEQYFK
jgi:S-adenosylmethionine:tRNA ribosyltransferase-isomerase